jgi:hypothetical protein
MFILITSFGKVENPKSGFFTRKRHLMISSFTSQKDQPGAEKMQKYTLISINQFQKGFSTGSDPQRAGREEESPEEGMGACRNKARQHSRHRKGRN